MKWGSFLLVGTTVAAVFAKRDASSTLHSLAASKAQFFGKNNPDQAPTALPGTFIAEFDPTSFGKRDGQSVLDAFHDHIGSLVSEVTKKPVKYTTRFEYTQSIFPGISLQLHNPADVEAIKSAPHVKAVHQVHSLRLATSPAVVPHPDLLDAMTYKGVHKRDGTNVNDIFPPHVMTGIDRLHAENITGHNVTIGVVDTGVDTSHPMLNGGRAAGVDCFGDGCQITGGRDFVGNDYDGTNQPKPGAGVKPNCVGQDPAGSGHGTVSLIDLGLCKRTLTWKSSCSLLQGS